MIIYSNMTLPALLGIDIDNFNIGNSNNYDKIRRCMMFPNIPTPRTISISSSKALVDYHTKIEWLNNLPDEEEVRELINSSQLFYVNEGETSNLVSKVADFSTLKE